jgi:hypothetical protein
MKSNAQRMAEWKARKMDQGWINLNFIIPPALAKDIQALKLEYKLKHPNQWQRI